jgi:orotate phosphoribosyltransferase-like protein
LRQGLSSASIADQLNLSPQTVWAVKGNLTQGKNKDDKYFIPVQLDVNNEYDSLKLTNSL